MSTAFSTAQYDGVYPDGIERHYWTVARNMLLERVIRSLTGAADVILEVGAGRGFTVAWLAGRGYDVYGVDLGWPKITAPAAGRVTTGTDASALPASLRARVTLLLLLDVLEHLEEPEQLLAQCRLHFPHLKHVVVTVPARQELWSNYDEYFGHIQRFDSESLASLMVAGGLEVRQCRYFFHSLYVPARILAFLKRPRPTVIKAPRHTGLHAALARYLAVESRLTPDWVPGLSLLGVGRVR